MSETTGAEVPLPETKCTCSRSILTYDGPNVDCPHHGQCASYGHPCHCDATPAMRAPAAREDERAAIVAWLRRKQHHHEQQYDQVHDHFHKDTAEAFEDAADGLLHGEHRAAQR